MFPRCCPWVTAFSLALFVGLASFVTYTFLPQNPGEAQAQTTTPTKTSNDWPMFGGSPQRNMANTTSKNAPVEWQVEEELKNIKWVAKIGTRAYGGPVVADGKVLVGTNNDQPRDPKAKGPKGVVMCFEAATGKFLWQNLHDMPAGEIVREALRDGMCSTPTIEGDKVYYVTPACVVFCGNLKDGSKVWEYDMMDKMKVFPNYLGNCAPLIVGDTVYVVTGNGTDEQGKLVSPKAPSFAAFDKKTGEVKWQSALPGDKIIEGQWGNPAYAEVNGEGQVIFPGGDAYLYGLDPASGKLLWKFHCNPVKEEEDARKRGLPNYLVSTPVIYDNKAYIGVGMYPEHPIGNKNGHFWCVDLAKATKFGATNKDHDVSPKNDNFDPTAEVNKTSALAWHFGGEMDPRPKFGRSALIGRTFATAAIHDGLVFISEEYGFLHCLDAKTGKRHWEHDFKTGIWDSAFYVDGKVYIGTDDGDVVIFNAGREKKVLETIYMEEPVQNTPVFAGNTLYIMTKSKLYAVGG